MTSVIGESLASCSIANGGGHGTALLCHFFLQSALEMKAGSVHTTASFSFSPLAHMCMICACVYPWELDISAEPWSTDGFLSVTEVNGFALVSPNTCDISMGFSLVLFFFFNIII